ncbi:MAG: DUF262 domain-containing protein [Betaproteobacteria bacterium]|nr:DUF262 domain-containing protein [Betaproteobacteria bacterium]
MQKPTNDYVVIATDQELERLEAEIKAKQVEVKYDTRDFVVDYIVDKYREDFFYVPAYQREFIWKLDLQSAFIESLVLGLPIPMLFLADMDDGRLEIVDGAQRVRTLESFTNDAFSLSGLKAIPSLNGFRFSQMPKAQQRKLLTKALRCIVLEDSTTEQVRQDIFHRINRHGSKVKAVEARRGSLQGPFIAFIQQMASRPLFRKLCPISAALLARRRTRNLLLGSSLFRFVQILQARC